jgi:hypothetical protein
MLEEFVSYYNADELEGFIHDGLQEQVDDSAARMVHILGGRACEVAALLSEMAANREHPLFETVGRQTMVDWNADPVWWDAFQAIAERMADRIAAALG